jgi:hypothetical protein
MRCVTPPPDQCVERAKRMKRLTPLALLVLINLPFATGRVAARQSGGSGSEVKEVYTRIREAIRVRDTKVLETNIADDYLLTDSSGAVLSKAQFIDRIRTVDGEEVHTEVDDVRVRLYGGVAVITSRISVVDSTITDNFSGQWRETGVYVKRQGRWSLTSSQETPIRR